MRWSDNVVLLLSTAHYDMYTQAYQLEVGANPYNTSFDKAVLEGSNLELLVEPGLAAHNKPIITSRNNFAMDIDMARLANIEMEYDMKTRSIAIVCDYFVGANFAIGQEIWMTGWTL